MIIIKRNITFIIITILIVLLGASLFLVLKYYKQSVDYSSYKEYENISNYLSEEYSILDNEINQHQADMANYVLLHKEDIISFYKDFIDEYNSSEDLMKIEPSRPIRKDNEFVCELLTKYKLEYFYSENCAYMSFDGNDRVDFIFNIDEFDKGDYYKDCIYSFYVENELIFINPYFYTANFNGV